MRLVKMECPHCGAQLRDNPNGNTVFCEYCGAKVLIDDGNTTHTTNKNINIEKKVHIRHTDDADVIRAENEIAKDKQDFRHIFILLGCMLFFPVTIFSGMGLSKCSAQISGKINAGNHGDLEGKDYKTVKSTLEGAGFTNIELIDLDDAGIAFWNEEKVDTVSIGGNSNFVSSDWFEPDAKVVISYH